MYKKVVKVAIFLLSLVLTCSSWALDDILIGVSDHVYESFLDWTSLNKCTSITDFNSEHANRGAVEMVLLCQALHLGGVKTSLELKAFPNTKRVLLEASNGKVDLAGESYWQEEITSSTLLESKAIIHDGEYEKGIYFHQENRLMRNVKTLKELCDKSVIMPKHWIAERKFIKRMGCRKLLNASRVAQMYLLVEAGRADFALLDFTNRDKVASEYEEFTLFPLKGMKVRIPGSRHYVISKRSKRKQQLQEAINRGIDKLAGSEIIKKAFIDSGFFNQQVKDWQVIYPKSDS